MTVEARSQRRRELPQYTMEEVQKHNTANDLWIVVNGKVLDLTNYLKHHPGGETVAISQGGLEATDAVRAMHPPEVVEKKMPQFCIGTVSERSITPLTRDYRNIREKAEKDGLYHTEYSFYAWQFSRIIAFLLAGLFGLTKADTLLAQLGGAAALGMFWQQIAFIGHDLGHNGITHDRKTDSMLGLICGNLLTGVSISWWKRSHNVHHVATNWVNYDPDIQHLPVFAVTSKFFKSIYSHYHDKIFAFDRLSKFLVTYQHWLFYPVMAVARFNLYLQSLLLLFTLKGVQNRTMEILAEAAYFAWYAYVISFLPTWQRQLACVVVSHAVVGLLHVQICLSHFARATYDEAPMKDANESFFRCQLATSADVDCWPCLDWLHGGLQFQTIHHLFPRLPRHRLRAFMPLVQGLALKHGCHYHLIDFYSANCELLEQLRHTAQKAEAFDHGVWDALNAQG
eukprot:gb/GECG01014745.1/.p1 GENE.gb/GECG01014745.1/~~gb/GECG01014745.1/.p1  ORF type:complete len:454 (+),score=30.92 gb/GECG01014745.1/:1-1362(+)